MLPVSPSWGDVQGYLRWLAVSPYTYHLDDDATDCGFPQEVGERLAANAAVMFDAHSDGDIWEYYWAHVVLSEQA